LFISWGTNMNHALLYRPGSKWTAIVAFVAAAAIHLSALAFGSLQHDVARAADTDDSVTGVIDPPSPDIISEPVADFVPDSGPAVVPDVDFTEASPPPRRITKERRAGPIRPPALTGISNGHGKADTVSAPRPEYPYEARRRHLTGSGVVVLSVDSTSGLVIDAWTEQSIGSPILDSSAIRTFRRWRFKPGAVSRVRIPITFDLNGASY
jgi:TonB family protein